MKQAIVSTLNKLFPFLDIEKHIPFQSSYTTTLRQALDSCDGFSLNGQHPYEEACFYEIRINDFGRKELIIELGELFEATFNFFADQEIEINSKGYANVVDLNTDNVCKFCFTVSTPMKKSDLLNIVNQYE